MATLALNSRLWVQRLLNSFGEGCANGGSPFQGRCAVSEVNDGAGHSGPILPSGGVQTAGCRAAGRSEAVLQGSNRRRSRLGAPTLPQRGRAGRGDPYRFRIMNEADNPDGST